MPRELARCRHTFQAISISLLLSVPLAEGSEYFLSPAGRDTDDGSISGPWKTLSHAVTRLAPGDVLYLRGGTYYESDVDVGVSGRPDAPIVIESYPGEQAVIDGGLPDFMAAPNELWELVDSSTGLYRSTIPVSGSFIRAWLPDAGIQILEYETSQNLASLSYGPMSGHDPIYVGPGMLLRDDGRLDVRLTYNPNDLIGPGGDPIEPHVTDTNPRRHRIAVSTSSRVLRVDGASYVHFRNLTFAHADYVMDARDSHDIVVDDVTFVFGRYGIVLREGVYAWEITGSTFDNGLPNYVHWTDIKNRPEEVVEAYPEFQSEAIYHVGSGSTVRGNRFQNGFDGLTVRDGAQDTRIVDNVFVNLLDDAVNLYKGISNVEVACNRLWSSASGIANLASSAPAGHVYIHHNIIDVSRYRRGGREGNYREDDWPVWTTLDPFGRHGSGDKAAWWKVYNNTIVARESGYRTNPAGPGTVDGNDEKYVYNNVFYLLGDRIVLRGDLESTGAHYDGNVFYRRGPASLPLFLDFADGGEYDSLAELRRSGTTWEASGLEIDPGFDQAAIESSPFDDDGFWQRYVPTDARVLELGASYDDLAWPATADVTYRGAVSPSGLCAVPDGGAAPEIVSIPSEVAIVGTAYAYDRDFIIDVNGAQPMVFTVEAGPVGMSVASDGFVNWIPESGQQGAHSIRIRVDNAYGSDVQSFVVEVSESPPGDVIALTVGDADPGAYGKGFGSDRHEHRLAATFVSPGSDVAFSVTGFDVNSKKEVAVFLNGELLGYLRPGRRKRLNAGDSFHISPRAQLPGLNEIVVIQSAKGGQWGVRDLLVDFAPSLDVALTVGVADTLGYGFKYGSNLHRTEVIATFESDGSDLDLHVRGFDIDHSNEVSVSLNGVKLGTIRRGLNNRLNRGDVFRLSAAQQRGGTNEIRFRQEVKRDKWGVTALLLAPVENSTN